MPSLLKKNASVFGGIETAQSDQRRAYRLGCPGLPYHPSCPSINPHHLDLATLRFSKISLSLHPNSSGTDLPYNEISEIIFLP